MYSKVSKVNMQWGNKDAAASSMALIGEWRAGGGRQAFPSVVRTCAHCPAASSLPPPSKRRQGRRPSINAVKGRRIEERRIVEQRIVDRTLKKKMGVMSSFLLRFLVQVPTLH